MLVMFDVTDPWKGMHTMTKREGKADGLDLKELLERDADFLRSAVEALVQAALEAEMTLRALPKVGQKRQRSPVSASQALRRLTKRTRPTTRP